MAELTTRQAVKHGRDARSLGNAFIRMGELADYIFAHERMLGQAEAEKAKVDKEMGDLRESRDGLKDQVSKELEAERKRQFDPVIREANRVKNEAERARSSMREMERRVSSAEKTLSSLREQADNRQQTIERQTQDLRNIESEITKQTRRLESLKNTSIREQAELDSIRRQKADIEREFADLQRLVNAVAG